MFLSRKCVPRRAVLKGLGATIALPFLQSMVPAGRANRVLAAAAPPRFVAVYVGNGMNMDAWTPATIGPLTLSPTLAPLQAYLSELIVCSGLDNREGGSDEAGGLHSRIQPAWLTGAHARRTEGADVRAGVSADQIAAGVLGADTPLRSLELALESVDLKRACEPAFACTYVSTLSWRDATTPLPTEADPRAVFDRLFGDGAPGRATATERAKDRSILDRVTADMAAVKPGLGPADRAVVAGYLDTIRDVERRIQHAEVETAKEVPTVDRGRFTGIPISYTEHACLMFELITLAFQADITRVATLLMVRERSESMFPESGVPDPIHSLSHHEDDAQKLARQAKMNAYHVGLFAGLLDALHSTPDGDGTLLDRSAVLFGSGMSDSNRHVPVGVPTIVAGGRALGVRGGRHVSYAAGTPLANLHRTLLDRLGVPVERLGDSTGMVPSLSDV